jgi:hypothetical protein
MRLTGVRRRLEAFQVDARPESREQRDAAAQQDRHDVQMQLVDEPALEALP